MDQTSVLSVHLRPWSGEDFALLEKLPSDPLMTAHLGGFVNAKQRAQRHARSSDLTDPGKDRLLIIMAGPDLQPVGWVGYWESVWRGQPIYEIGWSVVAGVEGHGIATRAAAAALQLLWPDSKYRFVHAFPSISDSVSNAICRKVGFSLVGEVDFEVPKGCFIRCNDWRLDLMHY